MNRLTFHSEISPRRDRWAGDVGRGGAGVIGVVLLPVQDALGPPVHPPGKEGPHALEVTAYEGKGNMNE